MAGLCGNFLLLWYRSRKNNIKRNRAGVIAPGGIFAKSMVVGRGDSYLNGIQFPKIDIIDSCRCQSA